MTLFMPRKMFTKALKKGKSAILLKLVFEPKIRLFSIFLLKALSKGEFKSSSDTLQMMNCFFGNLKFRTNVAQ